MVSCGGGGGGGGGDGGSGGGGGGGVLLYLPKYLFKLNIDVFCFCFI